MSERDGIHAPCWKVIDDTMAERDRAREQRDALLALEGGWSARQVSDYLLMVVRDRQALEAEVERLRDALAFYADPETYRDRAAPSQPEGDWAILDDGGQRAREALREATP